MTQARRHGTVVDAFLDSASRTPDRLAFRVIEKDNREFALSYAEVYRLVARAVAGLAMHGVEETDRVIIALPASREFLAVYLGCLYAGVVPTVVAEPREGRTEHYAAYLRGLAEHTRARQVIASPELGDQLESSLPVEVLKPATLSRTPVELSAPRATPTSLAHLQATSGSTGVPKLAMVRHNNIVANVQAIADAIRGNLDDSLVSWLPLSHDMGLVGVSYALNAQIPMVLSDTANFLRNPLSWLQLISRCQGTLSPAPSSAFHTCMRLARLRPPQDLDLSSWRVALCGAEPVHESTMREFQAVFGRAGLCETTLLPVYGLGEATLAATISNVDRPYSVDWVDAETVAMEGRAAPRPAEDPRAMGMVCVGKAVPGHAVRVVDADGAPVPDRTIGEIEMFGPSVIDRYLAKPGDTKAAAVDEQLKRADGYLSTGDLGYQIDGELYITGRRKDLVIISGRNIIPSQLEMYVEALTESAFSPAVVAVGVVDPILLTEQLHLLLDVRLAPDPDRQTITRLVTDALAEVFGIGGVTLHWVRRAEIPRTPSGKIQRYLCRKMIEERLPAHQSGPRLAGASKVRPTVLRDTSSA
jgi:fatty-acyl-CoA synthase